MYTFRTIVHLLINIQPCLNDGLDKCFDSAQFAAEFIVAAIQGGGKPTKLPIVNVDSKFNLSSCDGYIVILVYTKISDSSNRPSD